MGKVRVGEIYPSKNCGDFEVIEYDTCMKVTIEFLNTGYRKLTRSEHIRSGEIRDLYFPCYYGLGYVGEGKYKPSPKGKDSKSYIRWVNMLERCYKVEDKNQTYKDCTVCKEWLNFQNFARWFEENHVEGWHIDKDILKFNNKMYCPEYCCFVPQEINTTLTFRDKERGQYPLGVSFYKDRGKFSVGCCRGNGNTYSYVGRYNTVEDAVLAYIVTKNRVIKEKAEKYKGILEDRVYETLKNYDVKIKVLSEFPHLEIN